MRSNVFVIGHSKVGKSPLAKRLAKHLGFTAIGASEWVKARYVPSDEARGDTAKYIAEITSLSQRLLAQNPDACVEFMRAKYPLADGGYVIEGVRNPRDFTMLYRPDVDLVFLLDYPDCPVQPTTFERGGVSAVLDVAWWLIDNRVVPAPRFKHVTIDAYRRADLDGSPCGARDLDDAIDRACEWAAPLVIEREAPRIVHADLPRTLAWVENRVFHNDDPAHEGWTRCSVFCVSSYAGHAPTFGILTDAGAMFSYVPIHRLRHTPPSEPLNGRMELDDLAYHDSREGRIVAMAHREIAARGSLTATFKRTGQRMRAGYIASIDWYSGNDLLHFVALANGQFALLPSHKIMFGDGDEPLPDYEKLRAGWRVGR
jgi:hypothetical protein